MKKLLAIVVLGLLWSGNAYAAKMKLLSSTQTQEKVGDWTIVKINGTQKFTSKKTYLKAVYYLNKNDSKNCASITEITLYSDKLRLNKLAKYQKIFNCLTLAEVQSRSIFYDNILQYKKTFKALGENKISPDHNYIPDKDSIILEHYVAEIANDQMISFLIQKVNLHEMESLLHFFKTEMNFILKVLPAGPFNKEMIEEMIGYIKEDSVEKTLKALVPSYNKDMGRINISKTKFRTPKRQSIIEQTESSNTYNDFKSIINKMKNNFDDLKNNKLEVLISETDKKYIIDNYKLGSGILGIQLRK